MSKNAKYRWNSMKIVNIDRENLHIFWITWGISMKFSGKIWLMIILKFTKNQSFTLSLEDTFLEKPQGGSSWPPDPVVFLGLMQSINHLMFSAPFYQIWKACKTYAVRISMEQKQLFADFLQNSVLKNLAIFTEKHLCWGLLSIKMEAFRTAFFIEQLMLPM